MDKIRQLLLGQPCGDSVFMASPLYEVNFV